MIKANRKTGGQILVNSLSVQGVRRLFCVAGESYLPVLDALLEHEEIEAITCRHRSCAGFMGEAYGKLTGKPGIVFVTRGPGACNASIAVHTARQDSTPMILFMGQVRRAEKGREAFQEIDVEKVFGSLAKWAAEIEDPKDIPACIERAFKEALSGRPGPVVLGLPEDMLSEEAEAAPPASVSGEMPEMSPSDFDKIQGLLAGAERPLAIVGGTGWSDRACRRFERFAKENKLPVATSFRRQDLFDHRHDCYIGELGTSPNPRLVQRVKDADVLLAAGARLSEIMTQGYTLFGEPPYPVQKLIHIYPGEEELGKVYTPALAVLSGMESFCGGLEQLKLKAGDGKWSDWCEQARRDYLEWTHIDTKEQGDWHGADMTAIFAQLRDILPSDSIVTTDAGNFSGWAQRYLRYGHPNRLLAPTSGAMGYAVPSAISASLECPDRLVLGLCGDGGFMMSANDIATAIHHKAKPIIMVCNNGMYGTIRMHQERHYPGRVSATDLTNPDFVAYAKSFGAFSVRVEKAGDFEKAWNAALSSERAAIIEIRMDPRQMTTNAKP